MILNQLSLIYLLAYLWNCRRFKKNVKNMFSLKSAIFPLLWENMLFGVQSQKSVL